MGWSRDLYSMPYQEELIKNQEILREFIPNYKINLIDVLEH